MTQKFPKPMLFVLSMAPFFIILGLMSMDIPISWDKNALFIGWRTLWQNTRVGLLIIVVSLVIEIIIFYLFNRVCKNGQGEQSERIEEIENRNFDLISFATSMFIPLISFQYDQLSHWIVTSAIIILIGYIFCTSDGYYTNPTLALFGYKLYAVKLNNQRYGENNTSRDLIIISKSDLHIGDSIRCYHLSDKVSFASFNHNNKTL